MATIIIKTDQGIITEHYTLLPATNDYVKEDNPILIELLTPVNPSTSN